uniref:Gypsy retrotransposon integrase-like protein 1 n=1 Tax=Micrurus surinamensis TaxID=129470 RepID=A0A2D4PU95_MICSU
MADTLSRLPQYRSVRDIIIQPLINTKETETCKQVHNLNDVNISMLRDAIVHDDWLKNNPYICSYTDGLAWKGDRLYIPDKCRSSILAICHDVKQAGHFGFLKTLHLARRQFWWLKMRSHIEDYVKKCHVCATTKSRVGKPLGLLQKVSEPVRPWQDIAMDFIVELPNSKNYTVIWTVVDLFSK